MDIPIARLHFQLEMAGEAWRSPGFQSVWRSIPNTLITQVRDGGYIVETRRGDYLEVEAGAGFLVPAGLHNRVSLPRDSQGATVLFSHCHCLLNGSFDLFSVLDHPLLFTPEAGREIGRIHAGLRRAAERLQHSPLTASAKMQALGGELIAMVLELHPVVEERWSSPARQRLLPVLRYIQENLAESIERESLAHLASLSVPRFHVVFSEVFGISPMCFVREERLRHGRQLLMYTDLPVAQIACRCGVPDQFHFSRIFKQSEGLSPLQYRQAIRRTLDTN